MTIRPDRLLAHAFPETRQRYAKRDTILYALGVGLGCDPIAAEDLPFLLEDRLIALPTFASTLGFLGMWIRAPEFGVNFANLVHYEQATRFHAPLPPEADIISSARVASVTDRGEGKGAVVVIEREIRDSTLEARYCTLRQTLLLRADGGFRGAPTPHVPSIIPDREPDARASFPTDSRAALIYRLSGDWNPLHADPEAAKRGGFERPILHGLASYAIAAIAVARACGQSPANVTGLDCRFTGVVFPGDKLEFRIWREETRAIFQGFVGERKALDQGLVAFGKTT
jgi:acyl dehydratase